MQGNNRRWKADYYLGTKLPYRVTNEMETEPPRGYHAFYINYLGKHSARDLYHIDGLKYICSILHYAYEKQVLSIRGLELLSKIIGIPEMESITHNMTHPQGKKMIEGIAGRMIERYPGVFQHKIVGTSTYSTHSKQALVIFCETLRKYVKEEQFSLHSYGITDPILRFYDINKQYLEYKDQMEWKEEYMKYVEREDAAEGILKRIFLETSKEEMSFTKEEQYRFAEELFHIYTNQLDMNGVISLGYYFNMYEKQYFWENMNLKHYMLNGPGFLGSGLPMKIAFPLLNDFLLTSEYAIQTKSVSVNLRFSDTDTLIPFVCLLGIEHFQDKIEQLSMTSLLWKDYEIAPLAGNIQWIFYEQAEDYYGVQSGRMGNVLVKMLYNEREVNFPFYSEFAPYYNWEEVKRYYERVLHNLNITIKDTMLETVRDYTCAPNRD